MAFQDQVDRRWVEQLAWAALVDTCDSGVLISSRASLRHDLLTHEERSNIINFEGEPNAGNLLTNPILEANGVDPDALDRKVDQLLVSQGVTSQAAQALARGEFKGYLSSLRKDGNLTPYYMRYDTKGLDHACNLFFNDIVRYLRAAGFAGGYLFIDDVENLTDN